jgi:endogenous inhibitor of DNA gyrase (YacG/DUF329 family)
MKAVRCPVCSAQSVWSEANPFRPFCSERCKLIDLGAWASDRYAIGGAPQDGDPSAPSPSDARD